MRSTVPFAIVHGVEMVLSLCDVLSNPSPPALTMQIHVLLMLDATEGGVGVEA